MTNTTTTKPDAVVRRLYARGTWKLKSVAHFGSGEVGIADMSLLRDESNAPFIPATSIAGAARNFLARQRLPWHSHKDGIKKEPKALKRLFGGAETANTVEDSDPMSALIIADAACISDEVNPSIRDGVRIDAKSGTAAEGAKFDVEVVERGTEFELNLECIIRHGDDNPELTRSFLALLYAFKQGDIRLGARTRRGYGRGKVESWEIRDLQMDNPEHVMAWLRDDVWSQPPASKLSPSALPSDQRSYFRIAADFELRTSLLIRSSSGEPDDPDMVHLHSNERPVVPGTSFAGAFRHRAALIANVLGWCKKDEDKDRVCEMFGPVHEQKRGKSQQGNEEVVPEENQGVDGEEETQQKDLWASRVWIEEKLVKNVETDQWQDRIAIDRFTGGVVDGALFNEKPVYPLRPDDYVAEKSRTHIQLRLTLEEPDDAEIGLLLLTLRDFWHGHAALGGETSNGRGTLKGVNAKLRLKCPISSNAGPWKFSHDERSNRMTLVEGNTSFLERCVKKAECYSNDPAGSRRPNTKEHPDAQRNA